MTMKFAKAEDFDVLEHQEEYARASGDPAVDRSELDNIGNLEKLLEMMIRKRRYLAQDVVAYPIAYMGRALDISRLQPVIEQLEAAIAHEKRLAGEQTK